MIYGKFDCFILSIIKSHMQRWMWILIPVFEISSLLYQRHSNFPCLFRINCKHLHKYMHRCIALLIDLVEILLIVNIFTSLHHPEKSYGYLKLFIGKRHMDSWPIFHWALLQTYPRLVQELINDGAPLVLQSKDQRGREVSVYAVQELILCLKLLYWDVWGHTVHTMLGAVVAIDVYLLKHVLK